ncbi:MAG: winged helix-turn-helix domain-containing protein [Candidatus Thorarchaeota archaeon]|jgi:DNA-binding HxlR family transcriptional regulator
MAADNGQDLNGNDSEIVLFEAISHPVRIKMLFALKEGPLAFSELKRKVGISSSGNLQHHIGKLSTLIETNGGGNYTLTDQGRESIIAIRAVRNIQNRSRDDSKMVTIITSIAFYVTYINVQFVLGPVDALIPIQSLIAALVFAPIFYIMYSWTRRKNNDS